jgi:hypothetical protein
MSFDTKVILGAIGKLFDDFDARWECRLPKFLPAEEASAAAVIADNWGGGFNGDEYSFEQYCAVPSIVADNWGGLFDSPSPLDPYDVNLTKGEPPSIDGHSASLTPFVHVVAAQICYQEVEAHLTALDNDDRSDIREADVRPPAPDDRLLVSLEGICQEGTCLFSTDPDAATDVLIRQIEADTGAWAPRVSALESYAAAADVNTDSPLRQIEEDGGVRVAALESVVPVFDVWRPQVDSSIEHLQTSAAQIRASLPSLESPWSQYTRRDGSGHLNAYGAASILVPVKCVLHEPPLGGYDGSLDDDPESGVTYIDAPLDRAVSCVGHAPAAPAALRTDAVGVVGRGLLAQRVAAGSTQATCSMIYLADDRNLADISVGALWEETMEQAATTLQPSGPEKKSVLLSSSTDGKLGSLKAYHLARGLCDRCDEKWHRGHKCNDIVQLHVLQEVWDLMAEPAAEETALDESQPGDAVAMAISSEAFFVSTSPLQVQVANGSMISWTGVISQAAWNIQGYCFTLDSWLCIPYEGIQIVLHGCASSQHTDVLLLITPVDSSDYAVNLGIISSTCVEGIILQIFNTTSVPYDVVFLLALSMRCVEWKPGSPPMQLGVSGDIAGIRPTPWPSYDDDEVSMVLDTIYNVSLFLKDKGLCVEPIFDRVMIFSMEDCSILIMVQLKQDGDAYSSRYISEDGGTYSSIELFLLNSWHQFNCHSEGQLIQCYWTMFFLNCYRLLGCSHEFLVVFSVVAAINRINDGVITSFGAAPPDIKELKCSGNYIIETVAYRMKNILENNLSDPFEVNKMTETLSQLILLAITRLDNLSFFKKLKYSSSVQEFCGAQFLFPNILLSKSWSQKLATNNERQLLPEMLEVVTGYICHELHLMLTFIGVTHMIGCGKYSIWIIGLLTPWDPGRVVFDLKFLMVWLEGKPNLKKGGMSVLMIWKMVVTTLLLRDGAQDTAQSQASWREPGTRVRRANCHLSGPEGV